MLLVDDRESNKLGWRRTAFKCCLRPARKVEGAPLPGRSNHDLPMRQAPSGWQGAMSINPSHRLFSGLRCYREPRRPPTLGDGERLLQFPALLPLRLHARRSTSLLILAGRLLRCYARLGWCVLQHVSTRLSNQPRNGLPPDAGQSLDRLSRNASLALYLATRPARPGYLEMLGARSCLYTVASTHSTAAGRGREQQSGTRCASRDDNPPSILHLASRAAPSLLSFDDCVITHSR